MTATNERDRCVACGVCANVCPREAVSIYKGCYAIVDEALCIGCGLYGVVLTVVYRPRTWCVFCPMGNMTQMISKSKA